MPERKFDQLLNELQRKKFYPIYLLHGEEPYFIDELVRHFENEVLDETLRDFNQTIVYGRDVTAKEIADLASRFPMMGDYQLVIVKEAQDLTANNRKLDALEPYIENPSENTILVFAYKHKKIDKRKGFYKKIKKSPKAIFYESKKVYDNQVPGWINQFVKQHGYTIDAKSVRLLADHVGNDLSRLANEINKLFINLPEKGTITPGIIERNIGISKDFNIFEFTNALGQRNLSKALRIAQYFEANPKDNPLPMITIMTYHYFIKLFLLHRLKRKSIVDKEIVKIIGVSPVFYPQYVKAAERYDTKTIRKIIAEIKWLDLKSKGYGSTDGKNYGPLFEFIYKAINQRFVPHENTELF